MAPACRSRDALQCWRTGPIRTRSAGPLVACGVAFLATGASIVLVPVASEPTVHTWGSSLLPTVSLKPNDSDTEAGASLLVQIRNR